MGIRSHYSETRRSNLMDTGTRSHSATVLRWRSSQGVDRRGGRRLRGGGLRPVDRCESIGRGVLRLPGRERDACRQRQRSAALRRGDQGGADRGAQRPAGATRGLGQGSTRPRVQGEERRRGRVWSTARAHRLRRPGRSHRRRQRHTAGTGDRHRRRLCDDRERGDPRSGPTLRGRQGAALHRGPERRDHQGRQRLRLP